MLDAHPVALDRRLLGSGGPPALAAAAVVVLPQLNGHGIGELLARNYVFKAGFCAWLFAQTAKVSRWLSHLHGDLFAHSFT